MSLSNPLSSDPTTITYGTAIGGTGTAVIPPGLTYTTIGGGGVGSIVTTLPAQIMLLSHSGEVSFRELLPDGKRLQAVLEPEHDVTPIEQLRISVLMFLCQSNPSTKPYTYIQKHNLVRHFKLSHV